MIIRESAFPRAALIGNPSDGYHGKTIAFVFSNYSAMITLYETPELEFLPARRDGNVYQDMDALTQDVQSYGYYGGIRLLKAAVNRFNRYCKEQGLSLAKRNFSIRYSSTIPNRLGLAGSSAIITAAMRGLFKFYELQIDPAHLANLVLATEREDLSIAVLHDVHRCNLAGLIRGEGAGEVKAAIQFRGVLLGVNPDCHIIIVIDDHHGIASNQHREI